jgi:hypothetical protein
VSLKLLSCEQLDVLAKGALVAFECENVIGLLGLELDRQDAEQGGRLSLNGHAL